MRRILAVVLLTSLLIPATSLAQTTDEREFVYVAGGSGLETRTVAGPVELYTGPIEIDLTGPQGSTGVYQTAHVEIEDLANPNVLASYSFHADADDPQSVFGPPIEALEVGTFCTAETLDVPADAVELRIVLNAPSTAQQATCQPARATAGTLTATLTG